MPPPQTNRGDLILKTLDVCVGDPLIWLETCSTSDRLQTNPGALCVTQQSTASLDSAMCPSTAHCGLCPLTSDFKTHCLRRHSPKQHRELMADLTNPRVIWFKGILFVCVGLLSSALLLIQSANLRSALLLAITVWAFCRAYYFAFYVIEHYVDPSFRFAGLIDFAKYAIYSPQRKGDQPQEE